MHIYHICVFVYVRGVCTSTICMGMFAYVRGVRTATICVCLCMHIYHMCVVYVHLPYVFVCVCVWCMHIYHMCVVYVLSNLFSLIIPNLCCSI